MSASRRSPSAARRRGPAAAAAHGAILAYQAARAGRPSPCRFDPSCSSYALGAVEQHGAVRGTWLAIRRVLRCHPWGGTGYDPVPTPSKHTHVVGAGR